MSSEEGLAELRKWLDGLELLPRRSPTSAQEPTRQPAFNPVGRHVPEPILQLAGSVPIEQVVAEIRERGLDPRFVDVGSCFGKADLLEALHRILELGPWFGFNWDALEEALHGPEDSERVLVCRDVQRFRERARRDTHIFLDIVRTVSLSPGSGLRGCVLIG